MKPRLQTSLGQHLVMTPQLRQAIRLLQLSAAELELEIARRSRAIRCWTGKNPRRSTRCPAKPATATTGTATATDATTRRPAEASAWDGRRNLVRAHRPGRQRRRTPLAEQVAEPDNLHDHLLWQLHLSPLSQRDRTIGVALIEAIDDDGYLRETLEAIAESLRPAMQASDDEILTVLHQVQRFDPVGVGARSLGECLHLQLALLPADTPGATLARARRRPAGTPAARSASAGLAARTARAHRTKSNARCTCCVRSIRAPARRSADLSADTYVIARLRGLAPARPVARRAGRAARGRASASTAATNA